ncbi:MAG: TIGR01777 family oxidoreductase [Planctomycetes bacterium]|nr:TIGR01777 family oxidoreductase [Planctomycetota bacterium]
MPEFTRFTRLPVPPADAYLWHTRQGALERLTPPWEEIEILGRTGGVEEPGSRVSLATRIGPFRKRWVAEHRESVRGQMFRDVQIEGPFARWEHVHRFRGDGNGASILEDRIEYELPGGWLGRALGERMVRRRLERVFAYRHATTAADVVAHRGSEPLRVAVTGATGLVGSALVPFLSTGGHEPVAVPRDGGAFDLRRLEGADAVVHLAGENIASGRWTPERKERIRRSRVEGTRRVAERIAGMERPPRVLVCASAIGLYGDRGDEELDERSAPGRGFLADVCREWEAAADPARIRGTRVVHLRLGIVLSPRGGALRRMLAPFRMGLGGRIGSGRQHMSWISIDDAVGAIHAAIRDGSMEGPVNAVAPEPVTNARWTETLARVLRRPAILPMPAFAARIAFGEMADALLLASARVFPRRLEEARYRFRDADLEGCLRRLLGEVS